MNRAPQRDEPVPDFSRLMEDPDEVEETDEHGIVRKRWRPRKTTLRPPPLQPDPDDFVDGWSS